MTRLAALVGLLLASLLLPGAGAAQEAAGSSLLGWVDGFAGRLEALAPVAGSNLALTVEGGRGVDAIRVERVVTPRLRARLQQGGVVGALVARAPLRVQVVVSLEGARVWAVGVLDGPDLPGPVAVAQDWAVDRELEALLGVRSARAGQGRWSMERLGTLPPGVLDILAHDLDGDGGDDLVVLGVDGIRTWLWSPLASRPVVGQGPVPLPPRSWPREPTGWIAWDGAAVRIATNAGHRARWTPGASVVEAIDAPGVPVRQPADPSREPALLARSTGTGPAVRLSDGPTDDPVRDVARWPGRDDVWLWIDDDGVLGGVGSAGESTLTDRAVGDRLVLADLDGHSGPELVTTEASPPGAPDRVRIQAVSVGLDSLTVLFEGGTEGSIRALDAGDLDFDGLGDLVVVEESEGDAVLWLIRRRT